MPTPVSFRLALNLFVKVHLFIEPFLYISAPSQALVGIVNYLGFIRWRRIRKIIAVLRLFNLEKLSQW